MDRICTPVGVMTMVRPHAGLAEEIERQERDDERRGFEPEDLFVPRPRLAPRAPVSIPRPRPRPRPAAGGVSWR